MKTWFLTWPWNLSLQDFKIVDCVLNTKLQIRPGPGWGWQKLQLNSNQKFNQHRKKDAQMKRKGKECFGLMLWRDPLLHRAGAQCKSEGWTNVREGPNVRVRVGPPREEEQCCELRPNLHPAGHQGLGHLSLGVWGLASMRKVHVHISVALFGYIYIFSVFSRTWKNLKSVKADQSCDLFNLSNHQQSYLGMVHLHRV